MKPWMKRTVLIATACLLLISALAYQVRTTPPAQARALLSCSSAGCNNRDPGQDGCTGGSSYYFYYQNSYGWEKFWYSPTCQANWTEGQAYSGWEIVQFYQENCPNNTFDQYGNCTDHGGLPHVTYCEGTYDVDNPYGFCRGGWQTYDLDDMPAGVTHWYTNMVDGRYKARGKVISVKVSNTNTTSVLDSGWH